jgi:hypothetical protein
MSRKTLGTIAVIIVAAAVVLAAIMLGAGNKASAGNGSSRAQIEPVVLSGTGDGVSKKFTMEAGVMVLHIAYEGSGFFIVNLYNESGYLQRTLADEKGPFEGSTLIGVKNGSVEGAVPGKYFLRVEADGAWDVTIEQPRVDHGSSLPITVGGRGTNISSPLDLESSKVTFNMTHSGSSSFEARLWADDGGFIGLLADGLGNYASEKVLMVGDGAEAPAGMYWLSIGADGEWSVSITIDRSIGAEIVSFGS